MLKHTIFFQAEDGIRDRNVTGVQTCALPISPFYVVRPQALVIARSVCPLVVGGGERIQQRQRRRTGRSEERRVGKECRTRGGGDSCKENMEDHIENE